MVVKLPRQYFWLDEELRILIAQIRASCPKCVMHENPLQTCAEHTAWLTPKLIATWVFYRRFHKRWEPGPEEEAGGGS